MKRQIYIFIMKMIVFPKRYLGGIWRTFFNLFSFFSTFISNFFHTKKINFISMTVISSVTLVAFGQLFQFV